MKKMERGNRRPVRPAEDLNDKEILQKKFETGDNGYFGRPGGGAPNPNRHHPEM